MNYRSKVIERCMLVTNICNWIKAVLLAIGFCALICFIFGLFGIQSTLADSLRDLSESPSIVSGYGVLFGGGLTITNMFVIVIALVLVSMVIGPLIYNVIIAVMGHKAISYYRLSGFTSKCRTNFIIKLCLEGVNLVILVKLVLFNDYVAVDTIAFCIIQIVSVICSIIGLYGIKKLNG